MVFMGFYGGNGGIRHVHVVVVVPFIAIFRQTDMGWVDTYARVVTPPIPIQHGVALGPSLYPWV